MRRAVRAILLLAASPHLIAQPPQGGQAKWVTLKHAPLSTQVRNDILAAVQSDWTDGERDAAQTQEGALKSSIRFVRLSLHGPPTIEVESDDSPSCGANGIGNCPVYLFMQVRGRAVLLFQAAGQGIDILSTRHHGMYDISVADRLNHFTDVAIEVDEFDGKTYNSAYCFEKNTDDSGQDVKTSHRKC